MSVDVLHAADSVWKLAGDNRVIFSELDHIFEKLKKIMIFLQKIPVDPGSFIILAVSIVISAFGISKFITSKEHRCSAA